jgi:exodeoxyribonuclease VII small subunit
MNEAPQVKYEDAVRELEQIVHQMENNEFDIDQLSEKLKRAQMLIKLCKDKLTQTDEEIKKILDKD